MLSTLSRTTILETKDLDSNLVGFKPVQDDFRACQYCNSPLLFHSDRYPQLCSRISVRVLNSPVNKMATTSETQPQPQAQQSWTAWFLDAYANSHVTAHEDDDSAYDSMSPTAEDYQESFVRTGRGGAGNFTWQSQQPRDLEAQKPTSLKEKRKAAVNIEHIDTSRAVDRAPRRTVTYGGRGGAGNFHYRQSNEIQMSPTASTFVKSPISATSPVYTGRGGAGNFALARSMSESAKFAKEQKEQIEAENRREKAEQAVQSTLQPPSQAYFGSKRRSALPDDSADQAWT